MRIIDKNHDYYDYLQNPTDTLVFDRRGSFLLDKETVCEHMKVFEKEFGRGFGCKKYKHLLLQCGASFWLFLLTVTGYDEADSTGGKVKAPTDYDMELLTTWKNYDKPNRLLDIRLIDFYDKHICWDYRKRLYELDRSKIDIDDIRNSIDRIKEFNERNSRYLDKYSYSTSRKRGIEEKHFTIPLLSSCGIAAIVNPVDIFCAIEEYFSREKTALERTEPLGATNDDKITMHGFDTKTSFRGK